jgi:hypothetical protein
VLRISLESLVHEVEELLDGSFGCRPSAKMGLR